MELFEDIITKNRIEKARDAGFQMGYTVGGICVSSIWCVLWLLMGH